MSSVGNVNKAMARGIAWMSAARLAVRGLGLISTFVLARLLGPVDFGLIAMASAIIALAEVIRSFSFDSALIQERHPPPDDYSTAWTLNVLLGTSVAVLLIVGAPLIAELYEDARITAILRVLALAFMLDGFQNTGTVDFRKNLDFHRDFQFMVVQKLFAFVITLTLAFWLRSYWALAYGMLASAFAGIVMSYAMHPFRPRFTLASQRKLVNFSKWMLLSNFAAFLRNKTADITLGRMGGPSVAGTFSVAFDIATLATSELVAPINRAVLPGYARLSTEPDELRRAFANVLGFISLVACPAALGVAALSAPLVAFVLGDKWASAVPLVQVLCVAAALNALLTNSVSVYLAVGRPKLIAFMSAIHTVALLPLLVGGILLDGAMGAAFAHLIQVTLVTVPTTFYFLVKFTPILWRDIYGSIWRSITASIVMFFAVHGLSSAMGSSSGAGLIVHLMVCVAAGVAVYSAAILLLWRIAGVPTGAEQIATGFLRAKVRDRWTAMRGPQPLL